MKPEPLRNYPNIVTLGLCIMEPDQLPARDGIKRLGAPLAANVGSADG
jgi:hypothetical protein